MLYNHVSIVTFKKYIKLFLFSLRPSGAYSTTLATGRINAKLPGQMSISLKCKSTALTF